MPNIVAVAISLAFGHGPSRIAALRKTSIDFAPGVLHVVAGPSGSGKTSLLSILGALLTPDTGSVAVGNINIFELNPEQRSSFRRAHIGYVFQSFRLMRALSAADNILLSLEVRRTADADYRCRQSLEIVGLLSKADLTPGQMSGGEQQRVAIARAIAHGPSIVLADEPTANLDSVNGHNITKLLHQIARDPSRVVILVSHDPRVLSFADRLIRLEDGCVVGDEQCKLLV